LKISYLWKLYEFLTRALIPIHIRETVYIQQTDLNISDPSLQFEFSLQVHDDVCGRDHFSII